MSDSDLEEMQTVSTKRGLKDVNISCMDCHEDFVWSSGEQLFFYDKKLQNPPKRCKPCKKEKNRRLDAVLNARVSGRRQRFEVRAKCARCFVITTVPFYPSQGRPVYCRDCFAEINRTSRANGANG